MRFNNVYSSRSMPSNNKNRLFFLRGNLLNWLYTPIKNSIISRSGYETSDFLRTGYKKHWWRPGLYSKVRSISRRISVCILFQDILKQDIFCFNCNIWNFMHLLVFLFKQKLQKYTKHSLIQKIINNMTNAWKSQT